MARADGLILNIILAEGSASHGPDSLELSLRGNRRKVRWLLSALTFFLHFKALFLGAL